MSLITDLSTLGIDEKQAKVYLALLEVPEARAQEISKKTQILRPTTYDILEKLIAAGLVATFEKRGVRIYVAERPEKLERLLYEKSQTFKRILPELLTLTGRTETKPRIRFYEGVEGIKTVFEDTLHSKTKELCGILSMADLYTNVGKQFMDDYVSRRLSLGYSLRVVRSKPKERTEDWPSSAPQRRELRYAPKEMVFAMTTYLYDDKVGLISTEKENFGMIIESREYSNTMNHLFEALWQSSEKT